MVTATVTILSTEDIIHIPGSKDMLLMLSLNLLWMSILGTSDHTSS